jgi:hypothetical protein
MLDQASLAPQFSQRFLIGLGAYGAAERAPPQVLADRQPAFVGLICDDVVLIWAHPNFYANGPLRGDSLLSVVGQLPERTGSSFESKREKTKSPSASTAGVRRSLAIVRTSAYLVPSASRRLRRAVSRRFQNASRSGAANNLKVSLRHLTSRIQSSHVGARSLAWRLLGCNFAGTFLCRPV